MHLTITNDRIDLPPDGEVVLRHQTWLDYEKLLQSRQDKAAIKIYFDAETHEIRIIAPFSIRAFNGSVTVNVVPTPTSLSTVI